MKKRRFDAVLFDLDGTLIDSIGIYFRILDAVFDHVGLPRAWAQNVIEAARRGQFDWEQVLPETRQHTGVSLAARVQSRIRDIYPGMLEKDLKLIPGAASVLTALGRQGIRRGLVTSTPAEAMSHKLRPLREAGLDTLFAAVITADDVMLQKPHAEPLIACAKRLNADLERSIYVGDACVDIRAGKAAGMRTVGVLTGIDDRGMLEKEGADAVVPSVRDLPAILAHWESSPEG